MRPAAFLSAFSLVTLGACAPSAPPSLPSSSSTGSLAASNAPASSPSSSLAVPGAAAAACTDDASCGTHRCNAAVGKCAFPCVTDADCVAGASCAHGAVGACLVKR